MAQVTGTVEKKNNNFDKLNILVNGEWYKTKLEWFKGTQPEAGDIVVFDNGGKNYIKNLTIKGKGEVPAASTSTKAPSRGTPRAYRANGEEGGFPVHPMAYERALDRRNAITCAVNALGAGKSPDEYIDMAREFEAYTTGSADYEAAKELAEKELSTHAPKSGGWD